MALPEWPPQLRASLPDALWQWWNAFKSCVGTWIWPDASIKPVSLLDGMANNNSVYFSLTSNKLVYKESTGTVHALYYGGVMPPKSEKQRKFMAMQLAKKRAGKKSDVDMSEKQLKEFATKPKGKRLPRKIPKKK